MKTDKPEKEGNIREFTSVRKKIIKMTIVSFSITLLSIAIVGTQFFYPFHVLIGLGLYILSFVPFIRRIYLSRKTWRKYRAYSFTSGFFKKEKKVIAIGSIFLIFALSFIILRPIDSGTFTDLSDNEIRSIVVDDMYKSITAMDYLETTGGELVGILSSEKEDANNTEAIENAFDEFLRAVMFSETLTDRHRYFGNIPYRLWDERIASFTISYSLYVKKYELLHRVMLEASGNEYKRKILNQYVSLFDSDRVYSEMVNRFYAPKTRLRINAGWLYMSLFGGSQEEKYGDSYTVLHVKAKEGYEYLLTNFDKTLLNSGEVLVDNTRNRMFDVWFPIQRSVANSMGHAILSSRGHEYFISDDQIRGMQKEMDPGDIMLQRRNWHLSNVGIPGFWTHSALYTGDINLMDSYFASEFPYEGYESMSSYLAEKFPKTFEIYQSQDEEGNQRSVIEAIEPGVVVQSLEDSAHADFVVTLRPRLSKHDKMLSIFKAFEHVGKPYDYNFDFDTRDALVCSELVYDSYFERPPEKMGIFLETSVINGRKVVSPSNVAEKYVRELDNVEAQLEFVYFIKGSEETQSASVSTQKEFIESIYWNKFSFLQ